MKLHRQYARAYIAHLRNTAPNSPPPDWLNSAHALTTELQAHMDIISMIRLFLSNPENATARAGITKWLDDEVASIKHVA